MKQFFKFVFGSCLGTLLALALITFLGFIVMVGMASMSKNTVTVKSNSVLHLALDDFVPERTGNVAIDFFEFDQSKKWGIHDLLYAIDKAATDDKIKGIYLNLDNNVPLGFANVTTLRNKLLDFKSSGKFVYAYEDYYSQQAYYLASVSDSVFLHHSGFVDFRGFATVLAFVTDFMKKIGIDMQVYYAGEFKSATEPFRREDMSPENKLQTKEFLNALMAVYLDDIAESRNITKQGLNEIANGFLSDNASNARDVGLIDHAGSHDAVFAAMRQSLGLDEDKKINFVSLYDYRSSLKKSKNYKAKDQIAVVYAEGEIVPGDEEAGTIADKTYRKILSKIRKNDKIKAVVLRVNSPGGDGMVSDKILRELQKIQETGKVVVASMGDFAASGGYYISCQADKIYAAPNTLTGSIGGVRHDTQFQRPARRQIGHRF